MAILTSSGRAAQAISIAAQPLHLAWGTGDPSWDTTPVPEPASATALVAEIGRRGAPVLSFVVPDPAGAIVLPNGRYTVVGTPGSSGAPVSGVASGSLHMRWQFDFADGTSPAPATIREMGVFLGSVVSPAVLAATPGKTYFAPADLQTPGTLLSLQRGMNFLRSTQTRQEFSFVQVF